MKKIRKVCAIILSIMFLILCLPTDSEHIKAMEDLISVEELDVKYVTKQAESTEQYKKILESYNNVNTRSIDKQAYDENYGGAYIDENGELVVLLVDNQELEIASIREITGNSSIKTEKCQFSYNELMFVIETINLNLNFLLENGISIVEMYEDVYTNSVQIGVYQLDEEKESKIRKIINSPCMEIYEANYHEDMDSSLEIKAGDVIKSIETGRTGSVGFCATQDGYDGIVISGHVGRFRVEMIHHNDVLYGAVATTAYKADSHADAAFVLNVGDLAPSYMIDVYACHNLGTSISYFPVGATIYKYGATTKLTSGKITSQNCTLGRDSDGDGTIDFYMHYQARGSYAAAGGDSGGPIFTIGSVYNGRITCTLLGIHCGRVGGEATFSKYYEIVEELDIEAVTY